MATAIVFRWGIRLKYNLYSDERDVVYSLPCGKQLMNQPGTMQFPATVVMGLRIKTAFEGRHLFWTGPDLKFFNEWQDRYRLAVRYRKADALPDIPGEVVPAWDHQKRGFWFAYHSQSGILAQGVGTGKSKEIIDVVRVRNHRRTLVTTTASAVDDWPEHCAKHGGNLRALALGGKFKSVAEKYDTLRLVDKAAGDDPFITAVSYDSVWREPLGSYLIENPPDFVVCDEIHRLSGVSSRASGFFAKLARRVPYRLGASGTSIRHKPEDGFGVFRFVDPAVFGYSSKKHNERYCIFNVPPPESGLAPEGVPRFVVDYQNLDEYARYFHALTYYVDSSILNLPKPEHYRRGCWLPVRAMRTYDELESDFITWIDEKKIEATNTLAKLTRLQQIASGFVGENVIDPETGEITTRNEVDLHTGKLDLLADVVSEIDPNEPFAVFCKYKWELRKIREVLQNAGRRVYEQSGARKEFRAWREAPGGPALLGQVASASEAIDLTRARIGIIYSLTFSLYQYDQLIGRINRPGQTRVPIFVHLIARGTVDERIYESLREHREVIESIYRWAEERRA